MDQFSAFLGAIFPHLLEAIGVVLGLLLIRASTYASTRWGIEIEARHREALHSALMSGIAAALSKGLTGKPAVDAALSYTARSVPDALAALDPSMAVLEDLATAKLRDASARVPRLSEASRDALKRDAFGIST